ncbi:alpha/beta hydrolase [Bacillus sp. A301a_S52]|nr:alpha/beta hydrolase [Bacillus sp. A301a_S52]
MLIESEQKHQNAVSRFFRWLKYRGAKTAAYDKKLVLMIVGLWVISSISLIIGGLGTPSGFGMVIDLVVYMTLHTVVFFTVTFLGGFLLSLLYFPLPRLFLAALGYSSALTYYILSEANLGALFSGVITAVWMGVALCLGLILVAIFHKVWSIPKKLILIMFPLAYILFIFLWSPTIDYDSITPTFSEKDYITPLAVPNPADEGGYPFKSFSYGNGEDKQRDTFNEDVDIVSNSVDASQFINEWKDYREFFWGFDETALPLNGRVWMPEGEGTFPLVLIVHGNHSMEYFSDSGYSYLGELLASRGYIAVSVDQNFLNYSNWTGIPNEDMTLRAWMLMQHLLEIQRLNETVNNPFFEKVDLQRVSLIGHSRGGQAVAMVADYERWFSEDESVEGMTAIDVKSVIAIAPTDTQVDDMRAEPANVSYLTLHGARDGDVHNYHGDRQYSRVVIPDDTDLFKAGVYIAEANHSQFNTDWGRMDMRLPGGLFLNRQQLMSAEEQREVAKVYISAFLETTLNGNDQYTPLFKDARYGKDWLPNTQYVTRYEDANFYPLVDYNESNNKTVLSQYIIAEGIGFESWEIESSVNRAGNTKRSKGMVFEWEDNAHYVMSLDESLRETLSEHDFESMMLSMANMDRDLDEASHDFSQVPRVEVELLMSDGTSTRVAMDQFKSIQPSIFTQYTINPWFDEIMREGKYEEAAEPVFQNYELPLDAFYEQAPEIELEDVTTITLYFSEGPGKLMLDNIGFNESE